MSAVQGKDTWPLTFSLPDSVKHMLSGISPQGYSCVTKCFGFSVRFFPGFHCPLPLPVLPPPLPQSPLLPSHLFHSLLLSPFLSLSPSPYHPLYLPLPISILSLPSSPPFSLLPPPPPPPLSQTHTLGGSSWLKTWVSTRTPHPKLLSSPPSSRDQLTRPVPLATPTSLEDSPWAPTPHSSPPTPPSSPPTPPRTPPYTLLLHTPPTSAPSQPTPPPSLITTHTHHLLTPSQPPKELHLLRAPPHQQPNHFPPSHPLSLPTSPESPTPAALHRVTSLPQLTVRGTASKQPHHCCKDWSEIFLLNRKNRTTSRLTLTSLPQLQPRERQGGLGVIWPLSLVLSRE